MKFGILLHLFFQFLDGVFVRLSNLFRQLLPLFLMIIKYILHHWDSPVILVLYLNLLASYEIVDIFPNLRLLLSGLIDSSLNLTKEFINLIDLIFTISFSLFIVFECLDKLLNLLLYILEFFDSVLCFLNNLFLLYVYLCLGKLKILIVFIGGLRNLFMNLLKLLNDWVVLILYLTFETFKASVHFLGVLNIFFSWL